MGDFQGLFTADDLMRILLNILLSIEHDVLICALLFFAVSLRGSMSNKQILSFILETQGRLLRLGVEGSTKVAQEIVKIFRSSQKQVRESLILDRYDRDFCDLVNRSVIS